MTTVETVETEQGKPIPTSKVELPSEPTASDHRQADPSEPQTNPELWCGVMVWYLVMPALCHHTALTTTFFPSGGVCWCLLVGLVSPPHSLRHWPGPSLWPTVRHQNWL